MILPWWGWVIASYVVSYAGSLRTIMQREWVSERGILGVPRSSGQMVAIAVFTALFLAFVWPAVLVATADDLGTCRARRRAELAELQAREARALAERNRALGIG